MPSLSLRQFARALPTASAAALALATLSPFTGCRSTPPVPAPAAAPAAAPLRESGLSLFEQRLVRLFERQTELDESVRNAGDSLDESEVRRRFMDICREYESLIADNPDEIEPRLLYGKFLNQYGDRTGAFKQFVAVYASHPDIAVVNQQLGTYWAEEGEFGRALALYLRAADLEPEQGAYHYSLGDLLYAFRPGFIEQGIFDGPALDRQMLEAFRLAAANDPENLVFQFRYGEAFYDLDQPDWSAALAHWERVAARDDLSVIQASAVTLHRARVLMELGRLDEAAVLARSVDLPGLTNTRDALLEEIAEAAARDSAVAPVP